MKFTPSILSIPGAFAAKARQNGAQPGYIKTFTANSKS